MHLKTLKSSFFYFYFKFCFDFFFQSIVVFLAFSSERSEKKQTVQNERVFEKNFGNQISEGFEKKREFEASCH